MRIVLLSQLLILVAFFSPAQSAGDPDIVYEYMVVRGFFDDRDMVGELARDFPHMKVDHHKNFVLVEVTQAGYEQMLKSGWRVEIDPVLTEQLNRVYTRLAGQNRGIDGFPCYRTVVETEAAATQLVADHPALASWIDIGDSWEKTNLLGGHDLRVLRLTNSASAAVARPKIFIMSAVHAREYSTAEVNTRFAEYLVTQYGSNADATWLLDNHEIHLLLQSNPDGRVQAESGLSWRKNTNQNYCSPTSTSRGADLNRNFEYQWGCCGGSSTNQCSLTYRGPAPASEPETGAIQAYLRAIFPDQRGPGLDDAAPADTSGVFIDLHSYGELVLWPWGWGAQLAPNATALQTLGRRMAWFNDYFPEQAIGLYPTDGTTDDFAYGDLGVAAFTFEIGTSFFQDCATFENQILPDNLQSLLYAARVARTPFQTPAGPESLDLMLSPGAVAPGDTVGLSALADDTRSNNVNGVEAAQPIAAAEVYIDIPYWEQNAAPIPLGAADGNFNSPSESVLGDFSSAGLANGRHTVFVRAQDLAGNWGPVSAQFFYVIDPATAPRVSGHANAADSGLGLSGAVTAGAPFNTTAAADGSYSLQLVAGTYDLTFTPDSPDYAAASIAGVTVADGDTLTRNFVAYPYCDLFVDDVEIGNVGWTAQPPWTITTENANSPTHAWTDSVGGSYNNNVNTALVSPAIDISGLTGLQLHFASLCQTEANYDYCIVEIDGGDGNWVEMARYDGVSAAWQEVSIDLQPPQQDTLRVRFRLQTDFSVTENGWYVDDVRLRGAGAQCLIGDADTDGVTDGFDNCIQVANADQRDTDADGYGNICDPDLNNDGTVNFDDLQIFKQSFFVNGDLDSDFDGDGTTNFSDLAILKAYFFGPPGPAAP